MSGKQRSASHCANISRALQGNSPSAETRAKMAAAKCGNKHRSGKTHSADARRKMSEAWKHRQQLRRGVNGRFIKDKA
jgi:hypothetical protein